MQNLKYKIAFLLFSIWQMNKTFNEIFYSLSIKPVSKEIKREFTTSAQNDLKKF